MGNILAGALTGVFIYMSDMVLKQFVITGGLFEMVKFVLQGWLTYTFVELVQQGMDGTGPAKSPSSF